MLKASNNKYLKMKESDIITVLEDDVSIKGNLSFKTSLMIKGEFNGEIDSEGLLVVGQSAVIKASVKVNTLISYGKIEGHITANRLVALCTGSEYKGDIETPDLIVETQTIFNGLAKMPLLSSADSN